jgi:hypothetical protein
MVNIMGILGIKCVVLSLFGVCIVMSSITACTSEKDLVSPYTNISAASPKMDSQLTQLVAAAERGEAASFAERHNIKIAEGSVKVIIECVPGQLEAARKAVLNHGAQVETAYENLLQVSAPVTSLTALAEAESIRFIRLPQVPVPLQSNQN